MARVVDLWDGVSCYYQRLKGLTIFLFSYLLGCGYTQDARYRWEGRNQEGCCLILFQPGKGYEISMMGVGVWIMDTDMDEVFVRISDTVVLTIWFSVGIGFVYKWQEGCARGD